MIIKKRGIPLLIQKYRALLRRLPPNHPKIQIIKDELGRRKAGYYGERSLDFPLGFLDEKKYAIFHDLRLQDQSRYFQMDTLLLSEKYALIIEVKNMAGTLFFDPIFNQLIQTVDGVEKAYPDPIFQMERQASQLKTWLIKNRLPHFPIFTLLVISHPQTIIRTTPENHKLSLQVLHRDALPKKINQLEKQLSPSTITQKELKKATRLLKNGHCEADFAMLDRFQIAPGEVIRGAICSNCQAHPLLKTHGSWYCSNCQKKCKDAHVAALKDYELLFGHTITNRKCRQFLHMTSPGQTTRLLQSMNLTHTGSNKGRIYHLTEDGEEFVDSRRIEDK